MTEFMNYLMKYADLILDDRNEIEQYVRSEMLMSQFWLEINSSPGQHFV